MKTSPLLVWLLVVGLAQAQNTQVLQWFENKKIITTRTGEEVSGPKRDSTTTTPDTRISESHSKSETLDEISIEKQAKGWKVELLAQKKLMTIESAGQKTIYDSDNIFERDQMANMIGAKHDPYMKKKLQLQYDSKGERINKSEGNKGLEDFWLGSSPMFQTSQIWQSRVVFTQLIGVPIQQGHSWRDTVRLKEDTYLLVYTIEKAADNQVFIRITGSNKAGVEASKNLRYGKVTDLGTVYSALLMVNTSNYLILKADVTITSEILFSMPIGSAIQQSISTYTLSNTLKDLKK